MDSTNNIATTQMTDDWVVWHVRPVGISFRASTSYWFHQLPVRVFPSDPDVCYDTRERGYTYTTLRSWQWINLKWLDIVARFVCIVQRHTCTDISVSVFICCSVFLLTATLTMFAVELLFLLLYFCCTNVTWKLINLLTKFCLAHCAAIRFRTSADCVHGLRLYHNCDSTTIRLRYDYDKQESPAVADKPARRLRKVCTVCVRAVGL